VLLSLDRVSLAFGHLPLLDHVNLAIEPGERIAVLGRNGEGKSTLLKVLAGDLAPDSGIIRRAPDARVARLAQEASGSESGTVFDVVAGGLGELRDLVAAYHHAASAVGHGGGADAIAELGRLQHALEQRDGWRIEQRIESILTMLVSIPMRTSVRCPAAGGAVSCSPRRWSRHPRCCCSTSRQTISIWTPLSGSNAS
jgi:ATP-binding cassette subfamily F protein uup